jgi:GT2 family glycosyltransferase
MPSSRPELTVVIPTHKRPDLLEILLRSLAKQTLDAEAYEVVVVDDGSRDSTSSVLSAAQSFLPNLTWKVLDRGRGPAAARNAGVAMAKGALILFVDDDIEATPDLLATHLHIQNEARDASLGVLGRVDWHPSLEITTFMKWLDSSGLQFAYDTWLRPGPVDPPVGAFYTANVSVPRRLLEDVGGFNERFPFAAYEDMELAWRMWKRGFRMDYHPEAQAYHTRPIDLTTFRARMAKVGESAVLLGAVQPDFPLEADHTPQRWGDPGVLRRLKLAALTRLSPTPKRLTSRYKAEISTSYRKGLRRGRSRLREKEDARLLEQGNE